MSDFDEFEQLPNESEKESSSKVFLFLCLFLLVLTGLPALVIASVFYVIFFRALRYKPYFTFIVYTIILIILSLFIVIFKQTLANSYFSLYLTICTFLGFSAGMLFVFYRGYLLKRSPELTLLKGWAYQFKYRENPLDKMKRKRIIHQCREGQLNSLEGAPIGVLDAPVTMDDGTEYKAIEPVYSYYEEALRTRFVMGLTGSGKTITLLNLMNNDIVAGLPICVIDFKKGADLAYFLSKKAKEYGRPFYHFLSGRVGEYRNPYCDNQASYDPFSSGTSTSKADVMLNLREWDTQSNVYKGRTQSILQAVFYLLEVVDKQALPRIPWNQGGFAQFVAALKTENLFDMISWLEKDIKSRNATQGEINRLTELQGLYRDITKSGKSPIKDQIEELMIICRTLVLSSYSDWLSAGETPYHIDLFKLATSKDAPIILFQFNPNEESEFAQYLGNLILTDLARASAMKQKLGNKQLFGLYIDECQSLNPDRLSTLVEKVRGAGFFTTLSAQSSNQISKLATRNAEDTLLSLLDTINSFIIHAGSTEKTATTLAQIVSKVDKIQYKTSGTRSSGFFSFNRKNHKTSKVSSSIEKVYKVEPHEMQSLASPSKKNGYKSQAYYITKLTSDPTFKDETKPVARKVWVIPDKSVLEEPTQEFLNDFNHISSLKPSPPPPQKQPKSEEEDILDDNFKIEKIEDESTPQEETFDEYAPPPSMSEVLKEAYEDYALSQKTFIKKHKREQLEKQTKTTSFDKIVRNKQKQSKKTSVNGLPDLSEL